MRFMYEKYVKFNLTSEKSLFGKYKEEYLNFFKKIFLNDNSCIKQLFIETFPVLKDKYFINEDLLNYIFKEKIYIFNFKNNDFVGRTDSSTLNIYIKNNFENNEDKIEVEICVFASYIIILIHEIVNFIRLYILKYLDKKEYKFFEFDDNIKTDIGYFMEINLFGKIMEKINVLEAIYIFNIDNYLQDKEDFLKGFINLEKNNNQFLDMIQINENVKIFLKNVEIEGLDKLTKLERHSELKIKGIENGLVIGKNNDKLYFPERIKEANEYLLKRYSKNKI